MNKYVIFYAGGSGGYMFYYGMYLLLGINVQEAFKKNWGIKSFETWKDTETRVTPESQVKMHCKKYDVYPGRTNIVVYTDIETQKNICELKKAYWYRFTQFRDAAELANFKAHLNPATIMYNGILIDATLSRIIDKADHTFLLQDVVSTRFKCVSDTLGIEQPPAVAVHINDWIMMHPPEIQKQLGYYE